MGLRFLPESTCDPTVTCDLPGIIEAIELEHPDLQAQYLGPRYPDLSWRTQSSKGQAQALTLQIQSLTGLQKDSDV